uniref:Uncharacterized protein n=1 Tax=Globisporangium ultimum (strain ATCC 200006 / CBS 805.95 / DAOM BR144) TaxID=431595 RepID=K3WHI6_GLOUD
MADQKTRKRTAPASPRSLLRSAPLLSSPWLSHELFPATKRVASAPDGLAVAKKSAVAKVLQELKKGRKYVDNQLLHLEAQLVNVSDFLANSASTKLFTDYGLPDGQVYATENGAAGETTIGNQMMDGEEVPTSPNSAGLRSKFVQHNFPVTATATSSTANPLNPAETVEDDLASDTPCTTIGLWKYLSAYEIFRNVTLEDVEAALQLEEPNPLENDRDQELATVFHELGDTKDTVEKEDASSGSPMDELLKARLVAAIVPIPKQHVRTSEKPFSEEKAEGKQEVEGDSNGRCINEGDTHKKEKVEETFVEEDKTASWSAGGISAALRDAGVIELDDDEVRKRMQSPEDDEVSSEIRYLEETLREQIHQSNETKRVLRNLLQKLKPWLSQQEEQDQATEKKYLSMWRRKKELERKQKLKDKKLMRKEALTANVKPPAVS